MFFKRAIFGDEILEWGKKGDDVVCDQPRWHLIAHLKLRNLILIIIKQ